MEPVTKEFSFSTDEGYQRSYRLFSPFAYAWFEKPAPLVIVLHGSGENSRLVESESRFNEIAALNGFIVVYPNGVGKQSHRANWNIGECCRYDVSPRANDVNFLNRVIDEAQEKYRIDGNRVFIAGFSGGAVMAYRYACEGGHRIAGILAVSGHGNEWEDCAMAKPSHVVTIIERDDSFYGDSVFGKNYEHFSPAGIKIGGEEICAKGGEIQTLYKSQKETTYMLSQQCRFGIKRVHYRLDGGSHGWHNVRILERDTRILGEEILVSKTDAELAWRAFGHDIELPLRYKNN